MTPAARIALTAVSVAVITRHAVTSAGTALL